MADNKPEQSANDVIRFVDDYPSEVDQFGSHKRVADALYRVLTEYPEIKVIGLLGGWGSGKSSVVRQTKKRFGINESEPESDECSDSNENVVFFEYDTWLHQSDNPRRSFLEALIQHLIDRGLLLENDWENDLESLAGRNEDTVTTSTKTLTKAGKLTLVLTGLVPFGLALIDFQLIKEAFGVVSTDTNQFLAILLLIAGIFLIFAPLIGMAFLWMKWLDWQGKKRDKVLQFFSPNHWKSRKKEYETESIVSLLTNRDVENVQHKTKISPEPTSIEFQKTLNKVMVGLNGSQKELICVIDNLDRLSPDEAVEMWSTMRSLFLGTAFSRDTSLIPTVILPIDDSAIFEMFSADNDRENLERAISFSEKTFDIVFHVTEPIQSGWQDYLESKLEYAFQKLISADEKYQIIKFVEDHVGARQLGIDQKPRRITPRNLNKIVNGIASLKLTREGNEIGILAMAYYVINKEAIDEDLIDFISDEKHTIKRYYQEWQRDIAAIHHGVKTDIAFQIVLDEPLRAAIRDVNFENFDKLCKSPGFWPVLDKEIDRLSENDKGVSASLVRKAVLLLNELEDNDSIHRNEAIRELLSIYTHSSELDGYPENALQFAKIAINNSGVRESKILAKLADHLTKFSSEIIGSEEGIQKFVDDLISIQKIAKDNDLELPDLTITDDIDVFFNILKTDSAGSLWRKLNTDKSSDDISGAIRKALDSEEKIKTVATVVRAFLRTFWFPKSNGKKVQIKWNPIVDQAINIVQNQNVTHYAFSTSVDILGLLYNKNTNAKQQTDAFFDSGHYQRRLDEAEVDQPLQFLADLAALRLLRGDDFTGPNGKDWENILKDKEDFIQRIRNSLIWYQTTLDFDFLHEALKKSPSFKPITIAIMNEVLLENARYTISTKHFLINANDYQTVLTAENFERILAAIIKRNDFIDEFEKLDFGMERDNLASIVGALDHEKRSKLAASHLDYYRQLRQEDWIASILDSDYNFESSTHFYENFQRPLTLTGNLPNALDSLISEICSEDDKGKRERWFALSELISPGPQATRYKKIRDSLFSAADVPNKLELFEIGGDAFWRLGQFSDYPEKCAIYLIEPFLRTLDGRNWLRKKTAEMKMLVSKSDNATQQSLNETILDVHEKSPSASQEKIVSLARELGLKLKKPSKKKPRP